MLQKALTKNTIDHSDSGSFSFSFFCDCCGNEWASQAIPFTSGGIVIEHEEARTMIWGYERQAAFDQANLEAHFHFSCCPVCGSWVCDECFGVGIPGTKGVCKECRGKSPRMG